MNEPTIFGILAIPAIIGLVQAAKKLGLPTRAAPALTVALGIVASLTQLAEGKYPWVQAATVGVALGLSACGLYAGVKTVLPPTPAPTPFPLKETQRTNEHPGGTR